MMKTPPYSTEALRQKFLAYFEKEGHTVVPSSSLLPDNDPTLLFTNAGMVQFKDVFLGREVRSYNKAVTCQRCLRASGKHNDLANVGYTTRHHTFFEMLGNFSFGAYFKREAIVLAWNFLTQELAIPAERLWVTVHKNDQEAADIWLHEMALDPKRFSYCDDQDNFWAMGKVGPCGYCSEIYYDHGPEFPGNPPGTMAEGERYVEIWNLVFMQFNRDAAGNLTPLPLQAVDTGMGIERLAAVMQGVHDNYETDVFVALRKKLQELILQKQPVTKELELTLRVVTDHIRAAVFLIADGVMPANEGSGYVLRSIIRRAVYYIYHLGIHDPCFYELTYGLIAIMGAVTLEKRQDFIAKVIKQEEVKFLATLARGLVMLEQEIAALTETIPGELVFLLHDTYGFPAILTAEIARQRGLVIDEAGFTAAMAQQRELSRAASKFQAHKGLPNLGVATTFVGYTANECMSKVVGLFTPEGEAIATVLAEHQALVVLDKTPFYAESGGQVGDRGTIHFPLGLFMVTDTQKQGDVYLHYGVVTQGACAVNASVKAVIDTEYRQAIKLNHSAAHLLHAALHKVLGEHALQRGSLVDAKRLRFDFTHFNALTPSELQRIEDEVNAKIRENLTVNVTRRLFTEVQQEGVVALFGEKYGTEVRLVSMGGWSQELCGGTHVDATGALGVFKIINEVGVAAGIRRIEAVTGSNACQWIATQLLKLHEVQELLKTNSEQVVAKLQQLMQEKQALIKTVKQLQDAELHNQLAALVEQAVVINGVNVLIAKVNTVENTVLRSMLDVLKSKLPSAVILLSTIQDNKVQLIAGVTKDLTKQINAGDLIKYVTQQIGGSGGGRAEMAQGGGTKLENLATALQDAASWIKMRLV